MYTSSQLEFTIKLVESALDLELAQKEKLYDYVREKEQELKELTFQGTLMSIVRERIVYLSESPVVNQDITNMVLDGVSTANRAIQERLNQSLIMDPPLKEALEMLAETEQTIDRLWQDLNVLKSQQSNQLDIDQDSITQRDSPDIKRIQQLVESPTQPWSDCIAAFPDFFYCDQNTLHHLTPDVCLLNRHFSRFMELFSGQDGQLFGTKEKDFTRDLIVEMHKKFEDSTDRKKAFSRLFLPYEDLSNDSKDDDGICIKSKNGYCCLIVHVGEFGEESGDPYLNSYADYLLQDNFEQSFKLDLCMPCYLLQVVETNISLSGVLNVHGATVVQSLVDGLKLTLDIGKASTRQQLVKFFSSLKQCVKELVSYYDSCHLEPLNKTYPFVPYRLAGKQFKHLQGLMFEVDDTIVKYVQGRYGTDVHKFCHEMGHAPKWMAEHRLSGGWVEVVMQKVKHETFQPTPDTVKQLENVVEKLTEKGLVHGDLRECNLGIDPDTNKVLIFHFDWSGKQDQDCYPDFFDCSIQWADGQHIGAKLKCAHDHYWLQQIKK